MRLAKESVDPRANVTDGAVCERWKEVATALRIAGRYHAQGLPEKAAKWEAVAEYWRKQ